MKCPNPACGYDALRPRRTIGDHRLYVCWQCGREFETVELVVEQAERQAFEANLFHILRDALAGDNGQEAPHAPE